MLKGKDQKKMDGMKRILPMLKDILQEDVMSVLVDRNKFLGYYPGFKIQLPENPVGTPIKEGDPLLECMAKNEVSVSIVPKEVFGVTFKAITFPLIGENGECIGGIGLGKSLETEFNVKEAVEHIEVMLAESSGTTENVFNSIEGISAEMEHNSSAVEEALAGVEEITSKSEEIQEDVNETKQFSTEMRVNAEKGSESVESISNAMNMIASSSKEVTTLIKNLDDSVRQIESIVDLITSISDQTNLLALNAAIEAARAGEQGKGFAVVADEVRKLAEESKDATIGIRNLVESIQIETSRVEEAVKKTEDIVTEGELSSKEVMENFDSIISSAQMVDDQINITLDKTTSQFETSKEISQAIESIAFATSETAESTQKIKMATSGLKDNIKMIADDLGNIVELTNKMFKAEE